MPMEQRLTGLDVVEAFLSDLQMGVIPIAAALSWIAELRREGFFDLAAEIEIRWPRMISTLQTPAESF
jgi:hypothetical protein